jgi:hypothetical protein
VRASVRGIYAIEYCRGFIPKAGGKKDYNIITASRPHFKRS